MVAPNPLCLIVTFIIQLNDLSKLVLISKSCFLQSSNVLAQKPDCTQLCSILDNHSLHRHLQLPLLTNNLHHCQLETHCIIDANMSSTASMLHTASPICDTGRIGRVFFHLKVLCSIFCTCKIFVCIASTRCTLRRQERCGKQKHRIYGIISRGILEHNALLWYHHSMHGEQEQYYGDDMDDQLTTCMCGQTGVNRFTGGCQLLPAVCISNRAGNKFIEHTTLVEVNNW